MNTNEGQSQDLENIPSPHIKTSRRVSLVWIVPLVAGLVAAVLAVQTYMAKGPTITIELASAEGLEAGKTRIKYKDVEVGRVESLLLDRELAHVTVTACMVPEIESYLTDTTRFWVVRARIGAGEVSGIGTLFSGVHIAMDPGREGEEESHFKGLEKPPVVTLDTAGTYFRMRAAKLGSINVGAPVYYRQIKVGQVVQYEMEPYGAAVTIKIFVRSPHDDYVNQNTRFWNASGMDLTVDPNGVRINTQSLITLLEGGIAFETPTKLGSGGPVDTERHIFTLFDSYDQIAEPSFARKIYFLAYFDGTIRGLAIGAPVEFRGIKIGEVIDLKLQFNADDASFRIPVLCAVEPDRIERIGKETPNSQREDQFDLWARLVRKGLRAQLRTGVLLTGQLYVNLDIYPNAKSAELKFTDQHPILPTVPEPVQEIAAGLTDLLNRLEKLPIDQIGKDLGETVRNAKQLMGANELQKAVASMSKSMVELEQFTSGLNNDLTPKMTTFLDQSNKAMAKGKGALSAAEKLLNANGPLAYELSQTLKELSRAARAVNALADLLERNPQSLIYGKGDAK